MNFDWNHLLWTPLCPPFSLGCTFLSIFPFYFNVSFLDSDSAWERKHSICLPESYFPSLLPIFLQTHDFILLYRWIILCHVYKSQFLFLLIHWGHLGRVCILTVANSASINMDLQGSLLHADFDSFQYMSAEWNSWVGDMSPYLCNRQRPGSCHHLSYLYSSVIFRAWDIGFPVQQCLKIAFWSRNFSVSVKDYKQITLSNNQCRFCVSVLWTTSVKLTSQMRGGGDPIPGNLSAPHVCPFCCQISSY